MQLTLSTKRVLSEPRPSEVGTEEMLSNSHQIKKDHNDQKQIRRLRDECYLGLGKLIINRTVKNNKV